MWSQEVKCEIYFKNAFLTKEEYTSFIWQEK